MYLHFYQRDTNRNITYQAVMAHETEKQYMLKEKPKCYYNKRVLKSQMGLNEAESHKQTVILTERNDKKAKELFAAYLNKRIDEHKEQIRQYNEQLEQLKQNPVVALFKTKTN